MTHPFSPEVTMPSMRNSPITRAQQAKSTRDNLNHDGQKVRIHPDDNPDLAEYLFRELVIVTRNADAEAVAAQLQLLPGLAGFTATTDQPIAGVTTFDLPDSVDVDAVCEELDGSVRPGAAMPEHVVHITPTGCCPATEPSTVSSANPVPPVSQHPTATGDGVKVVVVDTGRLKNVEAQHPWLRNITGGVEGKKVGQYTGHGTFVSGVLRAMAPQVIVDVNALLIVSGAVVESELAIELLRAIDEDGPQVISMSAGTTTRRGFPPITLEVVCSQLAAKGILLVAAAGNDGTDEKFYPGAFSATNPNVVSVGATDPSGDLAGYSNHGWPTVYALGSQIVNAYPNGPYTNQQDPDKGKHQVFTNGAAAWSGTSFATPLVAGLVAARMSRQGETALDAWGQLLAVAQGRAQPFGPVLKPGDADTGT